MKIKTFYHAILFFNSFVYVKILLFYPYPKSRLSILKLQIIHNNLYKKIITTAH